MPHVRLTTETETIEIPDWVQDFDSFRRWADEDEFPEQGRISFIQGNILVETAMEQLFTHNDIKAELTLVLRSLAKQSVRGRYFTDGAFLSNETLDISVQPDGCFALASSIKSGKVVIRSGRDEGYVEILGSPDLVIEVVSKSSVTKDTVTLREVYAKAGIPEYWIVDARKPPLTFDLLKRGKTHYSASRKLHGWSYSDVLARWFRLTQTEGEDGYPTFSLDTSEERPKR